MATPNYNSFSFEQYPIKDVESLKIGIVKTEWNPEIISKLESSCMETLFDLGIKKENVEVFTVPGSYELPLGIKYLLGSHLKPNAIICLGCVIQGETKHDDYINHTIARSIAQIGLVSSIPVMFGVLTTNTLEQALARAGGDHGNKGEECAIGALKMLSLKEKLSSTGGKISF